MDYEVISAVLSKRLLCNEIRVNFISCPTYKEVDFISFFFHYREGSSVQAEEAHHVSALEHHIRCPRPPGAHHACDGKRPDSRAQV